MGRTPVTRVRTSHALTIKAKGETVGLINGWNPTQSRTVTPVFEVGQDGSGNPVEHMPGNMSGQQVQISRFDTFTNRMETAFGSSDLVMLTRQIEPFEVIERWVLPDPALVAVNTATAAIRGSQAQLPSPFTNEERFVYQGCWFTNIGRTLRSDDNRVVNVSATLVFTKKLKITGLASGLL